MKFQIVTYKIVTQVYSSVRKLLYYVTWEMSIEVPAAVILISSIYSYYKGSIDTGFSFFSSPFSPTKKREKKDREMTCIITGELSPDAMIPYFCRTGKIDK